MATSGEWVSVNSSWVRAIRWLEPDRVEVQTKAGAILPYAGCSEAMFANLLAAPSKGRFVALIIKSSCQFLG